MNEGEIREKLAPFDDAILLAEFVKEKGCVGAEIPELKAKFPNNLGVILERLTDCQVLLRVGIVSLVYVHHDFKQYYTVPVEDCPDPKR